MTLGKKQELFMRLLPRLIDKAHSLGYEIRGGDLFRDPRVHGDIGVKDGYGSRNSCHKLKLAIDLNLFKEGVFCATTESHKELGEWWKKQNDLCRWGGDFNDGNHYSLEHNGFR
jgi:hypothetical protein